MPQVGSGHRTDADLCSISPLRFEWG